MTSQTELTRRAPHLERFTDIRPIVVEGFPDAHTLWLRVDNQSFMIDSGAGYFDTKKEAEWARNMLCIAIDSILQCAVKGALEQAESVAKYVFLSTDKGGRLVLDERAVDNIATSIRALRYQAEDFMMRFLPVRTVADLETLNADEILAGYRSAERGDPEPGENRGRAFWHGWRNAMIDIGELPMDDAARQLAREIVRRRKAT